MARMYHKVTDSWAGPRSGMGYACVVLSEYKIPSDCVTLSDLGKVSCALRTSGGIGTFNINLVKLPLASLVFACDWVLTENIDQSIRGCPVPVGYGSPLGVAFKSPSGAVLVAGSSIAQDIGFYCTKRMRSTDGGVYHVRICSSSLN